ncbi:hypothetical protein PG996_004499 [Apiospora saccharicola]|uniref:Uncharacterized protein n=1 Tax=Apiospora saccharicola TaxID=335842 RepID=A0ABR1W4C8_9PEZI
MSTKAPRVSATRDREGDGVFDLSISAYTTSRNQQPSLRSASEERLMEFMRDRYELIEPFTSTKGPKYIPGLSGDGLYSLGVHRMVSHPPLELGVSMNQVKVYLLSYWSLLGQYRTDSDRDSNERARAKLVAGQASRKVYDWFRCHGRAEIIEQTYPTRSSTSDWHP